MSPPTDVLVLAALKEELDALLQVKRGVSKAWRESGELLHVAVLDGRRGPIRVAAARAVKTGGIEAAMLAADLVEAVKPKSLAMCGVCAGHPVDTELGDVIIADRVFQYDEGKRRPDRFEGDLWVSASRVEFLRAAQDLEGPAHDLDLYAAATDEDRKWWFLERLDEGCDPLKVHGLRRYIPDELRKDVLASLRSERLVRLRGETFSLLADGRKALAEHRALHGTLVTKLPFHVRVGPIGSGNAVVADGKTWTRLVKGGERKVLGIEMEAAAIGWVAHTKNLPFAVVKGVMDRASPAKNDRFKVFAARASAEVLCAFLRRVIQPQASSPTDRGAPPAAPLADSRPSPGAALPSASRAEPLPLIKSADVGSAAVPTCFLAYSADACEAALALAAELRRVGIDARLDRHVTEPPEGWFAWIRHQLVRADFVLVLCSAAFRRRFETSGAASTEGMLAAQLASIGGTASGRWIPVVPASASIDDVPIALKTSTLYRLPEHHEELRRRLLPQGAGLELPALSLASAGAPSELRGSPVISPGEASGAQRRAIKDLTKFLTDHFDAEELRRLAFFHGGPELEGALPTSSSRNELAYQLVQKLWHRGLIDGDLFAELAHVRRAFVDALVRLHQIFCGASLSLPSGRPPSALTETARPRAEQPPPRGEDEDDRAWTAEEHDDLEALLLPELQPAPKLSAELDSRLQDLTPKGAPVSDLPRRAIRRILAGGRGLNAALRLADVCSEAVHGERAVAADERPFAQKLLLKWLPHGYGGGGRVFLLSAENDGVRVPAQASTRNLDVDTVKPLIAEIHVAHLAKRPARTTTRGVIMDGRRQEIIEGQGRLPIRTSGSEILSGASISQAIVRSVYRRYTVEPHTNEKHRFNEVFEELRAQAKDGLRHYVVFNGDDRQTTHFRDIVKGLNEAFQEHLLVVALSPETDELPPHIRGEARLLRSLDRVLREGAEDDESPQK